MFVVKVCTAISTQQAQTTMVSYMKHVNLNSSEVEKAHICISFDLKRCLLSEEPFK
jgi:hypothetical protein